MDWCNIAKSLTRCNLIIVCMYVCMSVWCVLIKNIIERNAISNLFGFFFFFHLWWKGERKLCLEVWWDLAGVILGLQMVIRLLFYLFICFSLVVLDCTLFSLKCLRDRFNRQYYICSIGHLSSDKCFNL